MTAWRYRYTCRYCDECFPCGAETSDDTYPTQEQALAAAQEYAGDAPWEYWAVRPTAWRWASCYKIALDSCSLRIVCCAQSEDGRKERGMSEGVGRRNNALVAELVLDQFESISPYVIKQLLRDLMEENKELRAAISDTLDTWEKSTADEFYSWFGRAVKLARPVPHD